MLLDEFTERFPQLSKSDALLAWSASLSIKPQSLEEFLDEYTRFMPVTPTATASPSAFKIIETGERENVVGKFNFNDRPIFPSDNDPED